MSFAQVPAAARYVSRAAARSSTHNGCFWVPLVLVIALPSWRLRRSGNWGTRLAEQATLLLFTVAFPFCGLCGARVNRPGVRADGGVFVRGQGIAAGVLVGPCVLRNQSCFSCAARPRPLLVLPRETFNGSRRRSQRLRRWRSGCRFEVFDAALADQVLRARQLRERDRALDLARAEAIAPSGLADALLLKSFRLNGRATRSTG